ncbi:scavenger receptor cysteine-rich type 1 protein M160-like [Sphaeramia orbicularis]|uniref:scavenger receptor cysteine-rich type 1 protein M160-like n=1 Tax=Sphaeramia orbicularis TaxID=375764 RepID=UPI001180DA3E|nr:scavenger receptor cysteine-rich type 1 protein M160-like [Sphaeramia orbicularis]
MVHAGYILALISMCLPGLLAKKNNTSTEPVHFRLVGGPTRCEGKLQVKRLDRYWRQADGFYWNLKLGNRVCAELDCGSAVAVGQVARPSRMNVKIWWFKSDCSNSSLHDCLRNSRSTLSLELKCLGKCINTSQ